VFVDEHADSINDGWFWVLMDKDAWFDLPASYHDGAARFAFADGHAEMKKWLNSYTKQPVVLDVANARWQAASLPVNWRIYVGFRNGRAPRNNPAPHRLEYTFDMQAIAQNGLMLALFNLGGGEIILILDE